MADLNHHAEALLNNPAWREATQELKDYYYNKIVADPLNSEHALRLAALEEIIQQVIHYKDNPDFKQMREKQKQRNS